MNRAESIAALLEWFGSLRESYGGSDAKGAHYVGFYGPYRISGQLYDLWTELRAERDAAPSNLGDKDR